MGKGEKLVLPFILVINGECEKVIMASMVSLPDSHKLLSDNYTSSTASSNFISLSPLPRKEYLLCYQLKLPSLLSENFPPHNKDIFLAHIIIILSCRMPLPIILTI